MLWKVETGCGPSVQVSATGESTLRLANRKRRRNDVPPYVQLQLRLNASTHVLDLEAFKTRTIKTPRCGGLR